MHSASSDTFSQFLFKSLAISLLCSSAIFLVSCDGNQTEMFTNDFEGWEVLGDAEWSFIGDELTGSVEKGVGFVMSDSTFTDFELEFDFKPDSAINSGVYIRCQNRMISFTDCYEINIWDLHPNQKDRTGAVVNRAEPLEIVETIDKWNTYKIKIQDDHLEAWINGIKTVDLKDQELKDGYIALQAMGTGEVSFRNVKIEELGKE